MDSQELAPPSTTKSKTGTSYIDTFVQLANAYGIYIYPTSSFNIHLEGRDKLVKIFQYLAKILAWFHLRKNVEQSIIYLEVAEKTHEARKMFRLLKSLFEVKRI
jgi:hypothetical protein